MLHKFGSFLFLFYTDPDFMAFFLSHLLSTSNPIHSYADDSTLHSTIGMDRPTSMSNLGNSCRPMTPSLTQDLYHILEWGRRNSCYAQRLKITFLYTFAYYSLPITMNVYHLEISIWSVSASTANSAGTNI